MVDCFGIAASAVTAQYLAYKMTRIGKLSRALGVTVLVEGVETEEQRVLLRLAGCDEMQGYLFARPAPARSIDRLIAQRKSSRQGEAGAGAAAQKLTG